MKLNKLFANLLFCSSALLSAQAFSAEHNVAMKNSGAGGVMVFEPAVLKVAVGDTVNFLPTDLAHNSESVAGLIPEGATAWKGDLSKKVTVTIDKEGVYVYRCLPHSVMAMVGVIVAGDASNLEAVKANSAALSNTFVTNKDRLNQYLSEL